MWGLQPPGPPVLGAPVHTSFRTRPKKYATWLNDVKLGKFSYLYQKRKNKAKNSGQMMMMMNDDSEWLN